jgi:hypothetical protein
MQDCHPPYCCRRAPYVTWLTFLLQLLLILKFPSLILILLILYSRTKNNKTHFMNLVPFTLPAKDANLVFLLLRFLYILLFYFFFSFINVGLFYVYKLQRNNISVKIYIVKGRYININDYYYFLDLL